MTTDNTTTSDTLWEAAARQHPVFSADGRAASRYHRENLDGAMCRKEFRTLSQALTLRYDKVLFILDPSDFAKGLAGNEGGRLRLSRWPA